MLFHQLKRDRRSALIPFAHGLWLTPTIPWRFMPKPSEILGPTQKNAQRNRRSAKPEPLTPLLVAPIGVLTGITLGSASTIAAVKIAKEVLGNFEKNL